MSEQIEFAQRARIDIGVLRRAMTGGAPSVRHQRLIEQELQNRESDDQVDDLGHEDQAISTPSEANDDLAADIAGLPAPEDKSRPKSRVVKARPAASQQSGQPRGDMVADRRTTRAEALRDRLTQLKLSPQEAQRLLVQGGLQSSQARDFMFKLGYRPLDKTLQVIERVVEREEARMRNLPSGAAATQPETAPAASPAKGREPVGQTEPAEADVVDQSPMADAGQAEAATGKSQDAVEAEPDVVEPPVDDQAAADQSGAQDAAETEPDDTAPVGDETTSAQESQASDAEEETTMAMQHQAPPDQHMTSATTSEAQYGATRSESTVSPGRQKSMDLVAHALDELAHGRLDEMSFEATRLEGGSIGFKLFVRSN